MHINEESITKGLGSHHGACGYLLKTTAPAKLIESIGDVVNGAIAVECVNAGFGSRASDRFLQSMLFSFPAPIRWATRSEGAALKPNEASFSEAPNQIVCAFEKGEAGNLVGSRNLPGLELLPAGAERGNQLKPSPTEDGQQTLTLLAGFDSSKDTDMPWARNTPLIAPSF
jgi:hypothetical protein